jgi:hypothetical protein
LQYVYDNAAKNVTRAQFSPNGGRFGVVGAYGGPPFPIIDTANPDVAGPQLIWNHLTAWQGFSSTKFSPGYVMTDGQLVLSEGGKDLFICPYYDPNGGPETFDGYLQKTHLYLTAPSTFDGQEVVTWHTLNTDICNTTRRTAISTAHPTRMKVPDSMATRPNMIGNISARRRC